jgi:hypothetical protein
MRAQVRTRNLLELKSQKWLIAMTIHLCNTGSGKQEFFKKSHLRQQSLMFNHGFDVGLQKDLAEWLNAWRHDPVDGIERLYTLECQCYQ